jgi:hypothetical protein
MGAGALSRRGGGAESIEPTVRGDLETGLQGSPRSIRTTDSYRMIHGMQWRHCAAPAPERSSLEETLNSNPGPHVTKRFFETGRRPITDYTPITFFFSLL